MTRLWLLYVGLILALSSCVTNKKYVYLQNDDVNVKGLPKDSAMRSYEVELFDYRIQPNDLISVRFQSLTEEEFDFFSKNLQQTNTTNLTGGNALLIGELVDEDGNIPFPVVGKIKVSGLTVFEAQDTIQLIASRYLEAPVVKVRLLNFRVTLLGEVNNEGTITLSNNRASVMEVLGLAGGLTDLADKRNIKLIRQKGSVTEVAYLDLLDEDFLTSPYYYVYQNDILIVPALKQRPYRRYFGPNLAVVISSLSLLLLVINL